MARDYLFRKNGSANWSVRFQRDGKDVIESLRTPNRQEALVLAAQKVAQHRAALLASKPRLEVVWRHTLEPGRKHAAPDGGEVIATDRELIHIGHNGAIIKTEVNGGPAHRLVGGPLTARSIINAYREADFDDEPGQRPNKVPTKNGDDAILETYIAHRKITGYNEREAREVFALFKTLTNGKAFKDCDRDDGRKLVAHFEAQGLKSATIEKKVAWLNAACNVAIKDGKLKLNPFAGVAPKRNDKTRRLPLADADMKAIKKNLGWLDKSDQLLLRLLGSTGMRIAEAFDIEGEATERGARYVVVGHKTPESLRRVPFPAAVLPLLPKTIKGPLFPRSAKDPADAASKRLNLFLRNKCGIVDPAKVVHSLRHRAQDRLRAAECPRDIRWALLGHEEETVSEGYGEGFSVPQLKKWIDKIGF